MLQRDPATQRGSDSYLGVDTLLRRGVHDHAALEDTCTQRRQQRGTDFRACTLRKARCHPAHGITVIGGCSIAGAETCQQSLRGAVLVSSTYGRDILAGVAMRRHREARSSHLDSPDTVLLSAHRSEQCGYQRGGGAYRAVGNRTWVPPPTAQVNPGAPVTSRRCPGHCFPCR